MDADTIEARSPKGKASLIYAKHKFSFGCAEFKEPKRVRWLALELRGGENKQESVRDSEITLLVTTAQ